MRLAACGPEGAMLQSRGETASNSRNIFNLGRSPMLHHPVYRSEFTMYSSISQTAWHCAPHAHECFELLYVLDGRCQIKTPIGDYIAQTNDLILFRPYQWHEETQLTRTYGVVCLRFPREFL